MKAAGRRDTVGGGYMASGDRANGDRASVDRANAHTPVKEIIEMLRLKSDKVVLHLFNNMPENSSLMVRAKVDVWPERYIPS